MPPLPLIRNVSAITWSTRKTLFAPLTLTSPLGTYTMPRTSDTCESLPFIVTGSGTIRSWKITRSIVVVPNGYDRAEGSRWLRCRPW